VTVEPRPATPHVEPRLGAVDVVIGSLVTSAVVHFWLVPQHTHQPLLAASFAAAAVATSAVALLLARGHELAPRLAAVLLGALLLAYPAVHLITDDHVDALDLATKAIETAGFVTALGLEPREEAPLAPVDVLIGVFVGALLLSALGHGHSA
jgi:hypothetical protein